MAEPMADTSRTLTTARYILAERNRQNIFAAIVVSSTFQWMVDVY